MSCQNVDFAICVFLLIDLRYKHGVVVVRLVFFLGLLATFLFVIAFFIANKDDYDEDDDVELQGRSECPGPLI